MIQKSAIVASPVFLGLGSCNSTKPQTMDADVIVIGAGLSGLNAALLLEKYGFFVKIVEATDRIGGRVFTADKNKVPGFPELGANGIGGGYARLLNAADTYGVEIGPMRERTEPREGEVLYYIKNQFITKEEWPSSDINPYKDEYKKLFMSNPAWRVYSKLNPLPKGDVRAWRMPEYSDWDISVNQLLKKEGWNDEAIRLACDINSSYGVDSNSISALMYFQILNFISKVSSSANRKGGAGLGGNQRIPEAMSKAIVGDILMKSPVKSIVSEKDMALVHLEDGAVMRASRVLCTLPASALRKVDISPELKGAQLNGVTNLDYTPCTQFHFTVKKKYWELDEMPPSMWCDNLAGRFMALKNNPDSPDEVTSCVAYTNSSVALKLSQLQPDVATDMVIKELETMRPSMKDALEPVFYWTWSNNRFAGGAYAFWKPGQITSFANELAKPNERIHFAGEHTAIMFRGMEGAMESGERAALEIMELL